MKPIFAIDITENKLNEDIIGSEFVVRTASEHRTEELDEKREDLDETVKKSEFPSWLKVIRYLCGIYAVIVAGSLIDAISSPGLKQAYENASGVVISGAVCLVVWAILLVIGKIKKKLLIIH